MDIFDLVRQTRSINPYENPWKASWPACSFDFKKICNLRVHILHYRMENY